MSADRLVLGNIEIAPILDVDALMPLGDMFGRGEPPPGGIEALASRFPDEFTPEAWRFRDHGFLIRSPQGVALVDTGAGPIDSAFGRWMGVGGSLPDQLEAVGVAPTEVDHVIITHIHSDHVGWNTVERSGAFVPFFPNARYHLHEADVEWAYGFEDEEDVREFSEVIAPLQASGQLETAPEDHDVFPGLGLRHAPGHTPGHRCALLDASGERVLFAGDLILFTFQLNDTAYPSPADADPVGGSRTRSAWLERVEAEQMTLASTHLLPPMARLSREGGKLMLRVR
jgi:glyoxylase-like metal-dependent hydrolase (beta-lactamase superfamily II)